MKNWSAMLALPLCMALAGCMSTGGGTSSAVGAFAGGGTGQASTSSSILDAMAGGLIATGEIGGSLAASDRRDALEAEYRALEYTPAGEPVGWGTRLGRQYGEVIAGSPYRVGSQDCRQYTHTLFIGGEIEESRGTACREPDGRWIVLI